MSQTICRHGNKAENMRLAEEKRERRKAKRLMLIADIPQVPSPTNVADGKLILEVLEGLREDAAYVEQLRGRVGERPRTKLKP